MAETIPRSTRVAALYDIHGNLDALDATLDAIASHGVDLIVIGGDVVPGPMPREVFARLAELSQPTVFIRGNGETEMLGYAGGQESTRIPEGYREGMRWVARQMEPQHLSMIAEWPLVARVQVEGLGTVLFCHATPRNEFEIFTSLTPVEKVEAAFSGVTEAVIVCGHTHMQFDRTVGARRVVNAGSVGMPFGRPGAHWLLLGPGVAHQHTAYDFDRAADRIRACQYPGREEFARDSILSPRSADDMTGIFERVALTS